jgi:predicted Zn-dependent peptidase
MKSKLLKVIVFVCMLMPVGAHADSTYLAGLEKGGIPRLDVPHAKKAVLPNGITCYLLEDHTLPIIKMKAIVRAGGIYDSPGKVGTAELAGMAMRSGGAGAMSPVEFDKAADAIGAKIGSAIGREMGVATLAALSEDVDRGLGLFFDMLFKPAFDQKRVEVSKAKMIEALRREKDEPSDYADRLFAEFVYGKDSPWARIPTMEGVSKLSVQDLKEFHAKYFKTNEVIISAAGDFDSNELLEKIQRLTQGSPAGDVQYPDVAQVELVFDAAKSYVHEAGNQSFVRMGHLGVRRHNPDWFALYVMSHIFGGGAFKSRLMEDIRTKRGLAYSIGGGFTQGTDYGLFNVELSTSSANAGLAVDLVDEEIRKFAAGGDVTEDELNFAKRSILAGAIFDVDSAYKIVCDRARFDFYGYPADYWGMAYDKVAHVTQDDVERVAKEYIHPEGLRTLVLGPR